MAEAQEKTKATDYGLDQTKGILESFEYTDQNATTDDIEAVKTKFYEEIKKWFDADFGEIWARLEKQEDKEKLTQIQTELTTQLQDANKSWTKEVDTIEASTKKLTEATKTKLNDFLTTLEATEDLKELMEKASERDPANAEYVKLEEEGDTLTDAIDTKVAEKMTMTGKLADCLTKKFLGISIVDMAKDPDSPYGWILRGFLGLAEMTEDKTFSKENLQKSKNPFEEKFKAKQAELEQEGSATIKGTENLTEKDIEANAILSNLQNYAVCNNLEMTAYKQEDKKMVFKAENWNQVIFLKKYLPHTGVPAQATGLIDQYKQYLSKELQSAKNNEYKADEKKQFPGIVTANSTGFEVTVNWENSMEVLNRITDGIEAEKKTKT